MEENFRASMMPAYEEFIKVLSKSFAENNAAGWNLWRLEMVLLKAVQALAVQGLVLLIEMTQGTGYSGAQRECRGCGGRMKFKNYRSRQLLSSFGFINYERAYYYCGVCRQGCLPLDQQLELSGRAVTPRLQRLMGYLGGHLSFGVVAQALQEVQQIEVNREVVRQVAEASGEQALAWERAEEANYRHQEWRPARPTAKTWIIECDGKHVGFQDGRWQEVKVGVIYELQARAESSPGRHELLKREIVARRCSAAEFAGPFWSAMQRAGVQQGDRLVAVADGAEAMEQIFALVAPEATRVRDFYHVAEKIHAVGEVRFSAGSKECQAWTSVQLHKLSASQVSAVLKSIAHLKLSTAVASETRRQVLNYLTKNRYAMDYARYAAAGWPRGSGAVEGGCRLIGARTNGCGRRWGEPGCDAIVALRVAVLNNRLDLLLPKPKSPLLRAA
jgi:Uncharacterised protein family (UPF0236)